MPQLAALDIPAPKGSLEGLLRQPDSSAEVSMAALVCHPHPVGGGTMHSKAVYRVAQALGKVGMPTLRFNFRGVGRSTGHFDEGRGEADDVRAALDYLASLFPGLPLCLAGVSFGAWVGLPVGCADARVRQLIGVGVPVSSLGMDALARCAQPKLIVQGERDEYGPPSALRRWFEALPAPKRLVIIPDAEHLFPAHQAELRAAIVSYFRRERDL